MRIVPRMKKAVRWYLDRRGWKLVRKDTNAVLVDHYRQVLLEGRAKPKENKIDSIVFSKDRAMQLHAFLSSYIQMVSGRGTMYILYRASNEHHAQSYRELAAEFRAEDFVFVLETDFRAQLRELSEQSAASVIGLFVDDMLFIRAVDYHRILEFDPLKQVVTLSRGKDLEYSQVLRKHLTLPPFARAADDFLSFKWNYSDEYSDWTYPIGVSGYFFATDEWVVMLRSIDFKAPNSLEANLQVYRPLFINRDGVCPDHISCVCIHANLVQTESVNPTLGSFSVEELLAKWQDGRAIDLSFNRGLSGGEVQFKPYLFTERRKVTGSE